MKNLNSYLIVLSGLVTLPAGAGVVTFIDQDILIPTTFEGVSIDLETGIFGTATGGLTDGDVNFVFGGSGLTNDADQFAAAPTWQPVRTGPGNSDPLQALGIGTEVGPTSEFSTGFGGSENHFGPFVSDIRQYLGFSLELEDTTVAYGWAEVTLRDDGNPGVIHSWAYDNTGAPLNVAAIPEPAGVLLMVLGSLIPVLRRCRFSPF